MQTHILTKYSKIRFCTIFQWTWRRSTPNSLNCYFGTCFGNIGSLWHSLSKLSKNINFREIRYVLIKSHTRVRMNPHSIVNTINVLVWISVIDQYLLQIKSELWEDWIIKKKNKKNVETIRLKHHNANN